MTSKIIRMATKEIEEYLGHVFIRRINHEYTYDCKNCKLPAYNNLFDKQQPLWFHLGSNILLKLTCNEFIIKRLLE